MEVFLYGQMVRHADWPCNYLCCSVIDCRENGKFRLHHRCSYDEEVNLVLSR